MVKNQELAEVIASKNGMSQDDAIDFLDTLVGVLIDGLQKEKHVKIKGLGTFKVTAVKERASVSVNSGKPVVISGHDKISFVPDSSMRELVNKPFSQFETVVINDGVEFDDIEEAVSLPEKNASAAEEPNLSPVIEIVEQEKDKENMYERGATDGMEENDTEAATASMVDNQENLSQPAVHIVSEEESLSDTQENHSGEIDVQCANEVEKKQEYVSGQDLSQPTSLMDSDKQTIEVLSDNSRTEDKVMSPSITDVHSEMDETERGNDVESEDVEIETNDDIEENEEDMKRISWWKVLLYASLIALTAFALGYVVGKKANGSNMQNTEKTVNAEELHQDSLQGMSASEVQKSAASQIVEDAVVDDASQISAEELERANQKVSYGAYRIVGVERVVTARAGQTLKAISVANLGPGSEVYVEALNDGITTPVEGQKIRIPKLEVKKKAKK